MPAPPRLRSMPSTRLRIAASIAWLAGSYSLVVSIGIGLLELSAGHGSVLLYLVNGLYGVICCVIGYLLRKRNRVGGILAVPICILTGYGALRVGGMLTVTFVLTVLALVLVVFSWSELGPQAAA